jgi:protein phosphatase
MKGGVADRVAADFQPLLELASDEVGQLGVSVAIPVVDAADIRDLAWEAKALFRSQPCLLEVAAPVYVVGDLHGNIFDLVRVLVLSGLPPKNRFLFLYPSDFPY